MRQTILQMQSLHSAGNYLGTIYDGYNTISLLTDAGDISKISIDSGVTVEEFYSDSRFGFKFQVILQALVVRKVLGHVKRTQVGRKKSWRQLGKQIRYFV